MLPAPEVLVGEAAAKFGPAGTLADEGTRRFARDLLERLRAWTERVAGR